MNKRETILAHIRLAGYHADSKAFVRLYTENRVSYAAARQHYATGARQKAAGMPCGCYACRQQAPQATT